MTRPASFGSNKPSGYMPRVVDARISEMLKLFGGVEITGPKWCGKTWSALAFSKSVIHVDDERVKSLIAAEPNLALEGANPHLVDEWQEVPAIWDATRRAIDASGSQKGLYLLTGSSTPEKNKVSHSGAGRIARINMQAMSLWEDGLSSGAVSLGALFDGSFRSCQTDDVGLAAIAKAICRGGWPALIGATNESAAAIIDQYLDAVFEISVPKKGGSTHTARRIAASLARNVATSAKLETLATDAIEEENSKLSRVTVQFYIDLFKDLFFIQELKGWDAPVRSKSRVRTKAKRYFVDPSLAAQQLNISPSRLLKDAQTFGLLFESLCVRDLQVYASALSQASNYPLRYYADSDGLEVDVIIELRDGRWAGIEIKLGEDKVPDAVASLNRLRKKVLANPLARNPEPTFMAVITANSPFARYDSENGVYVFPITALCP